MMITREMVSEKLLAYLDNQLSFDQIVVWAEQVMAQGNYAPDSNIDSLVNIVLCLAGAERPHVPSAQDGHSELMKQPETRIRVVSRDAA